MDNSSRQGLTISQQLARLGLNRFYSRGSGLNHSTPPGETGTMFGRGPGKATEDAPGAELAWEIALTAQSCASLAVELQIWAQKSVDREPISRDSICKQLSSSVGIFRALLTNMHKKFLQLNAKEENNDICVINGDLAEAILSMWAAGNLTTLVECMTSTEKPKTSDTETAGGTK